MVLFNNFHTTPQIRLKAYEKGVNFIYDMPLIPKDVKQIFQR